MHNAPTDQKIPSVAYFIEPHPFSRRPVYAAILSVGSVTLIFGLRRRDIADGFEQPPVGEPVNPMQGRLFERLK